LAKAGACTHAGALSKTGASSLRGSARGAACRVHWTSCAGSSRTSWACGSTHAGTLPGPSRTAVEDGASPLDAAGSRRCRRGRRRRLDRGRAVNRARPGLRHDHPAWSRSRFRWCPCYGSRHWRLRGRFDRCCRGSSRDRMRASYNWWGRHNRRRRGGDHEGLRYYMSRRRCYGKHLARTRGRGGDRSASGHDRGLRNHGARRRLRGDSGRRRRSHNRRCLTRLRNNSAGSRSGGYGSRRRRNRCGPFNSRSRSYGCGSGRPCGNGCHGRRGYGDRSGSNWPRRGSRRFLFLLLDRLENVARLRDP